eukprot:5490608-Amphidinium_carterae.2
MGTIPPQQKYISVRHKRRQVGVTRGVVAMNAQLEFHSAVNLWFLSSTGTFVQEILSQRTRFGLNAHMPAALVAMLCQIRPEVG